MRTARYEECSRAQVKEQQLQSCDWSCWHYKDLKAWSPKPLVLKV